MQWVHVFFHLVLTLHVASTHSWPHIASNSIALPELRTLDEEL